MAFCRWIAFRFLPGRLALLLGLTVASTVSLSTTPWVVGRIVDALPDAISGAEPVSTLTGWFGLLLLVWLVGPVLGRLYTFVNAYTLPRLSGLISDALFAFTLRQPTRFFQDNFTGALTQRIRRAANSGPNLVEFFVLQFAQVAIAILVAGFWITQAVPLYGLAYAGFSVLFLAVSLLMARHIMRVGKALGEARSRVTGQLADALGAVDVVHSHGAWQFERERLNERLQTEVRRGRDARCWLSLMRVVQLALTAGFMSLLVWFALQRAVGGELSVGSVAMLLTIGLQLAMSITSLGDHILNFYMELGEVNESLDALAVPLANQDVVDARPFDAVTGRIDCRELGFFYHPERPIFDDFSLHVRASEKVGLVGPSGGGKSTLFKLLTRRYSLSAGRIEIDGQDITGVQRNSLARQVAEVTQTAELFHRSVRENIRYGAPGASDDAVVAAAEAAQCHAFITALPNGYDTLVGERGVKLSGGERQRIAIARALLKDAPILLLDEATSALDSESEAAIQQALVRLMAGRTVIAIAHRLSTVVSMDRILYMEAGRVVESGTHSELLARQGGYARLWARQVDAFRNAGDLSATEA